MDYKGFAQLGHLLHLLPWLDEGNFRGGRRQTGRRDPGRVGQAWGSEVSIHDSVVRILYPDYPPEEGRYIRGNDFSPVAVAIVLNCDADKIPPDLEALVRVGVEAGAALSGTVQTENIGFEKIICNITANPNIRYLILGGPESEGHRTGEALRALFQNGVDDKKRIIGTSSPHPVLFNIGAEMIERFLDQVTLIDLQFEGSPEVIGHGVWSCYQESAVDFQGYSLYDPGAYPAPPLSGKITWRVTQPWAEPPDEGEREALAGAMAMIKRLRESSKREKE